MARESNIRFIENSVWRAFPRRDGLFFCQFLASYNVSYAPKYPEKTDEDWSAYIDATSEALGKVTLLQNAACTVLKEYDSFFDFLKDLKKMNEMGVHNFLCEIKEA